MIEFRQVTFAYPHQPPVLERFDWSVHRGETWAVIGPSGCGKSTLLSLLAGLRLPASGQVWVDGRPLTRPRPQTGLIIQDYGLLPWATVRQNAELGLQVRKFYGPDQIHAPALPVPAMGAASWLERLGLASVADKYPGQISGGQRQRTAIARTLAVQPDLLLMDEPFSSLDAPTREDLQNLTLALWREQQLTLVVVTHLIEEAALLGSQILVLNQPPNRTARVLENPGMAQPGFRDSLEYLTLVRTLREMIEAR